MPTSAAFQGYLKIALCGAAAATFCDGIHIYTDTLSYPAPFFLGQPWWTFPGFVIAFLNMAFVYDQLASVLPAWFERESSTTTVHVRAFIEALIFFAFVYIASGFGNRDPKALAVIFYGTFFLRLAFTYDQGFLLVIAIILGIGGTVGEGLLTMADLVAYREPEIMGVPYWLAALYGHGAFALREGMRAFVYSESTA